MKTSKLTSSKEAIRVDENAVLTIQQVAEKLQVSSVWLYKQAKSGMIPCIRIGGMLRFRNGDIEKWLSDHKMNDTPIQEKNEDSRVA